MCPQTKTSPPPMCTHTHGPTNQPTNQPTDRPLVGRSSCSRAIRPDLCANGPRLSGDPLTKGGAGMQVGHTMKAGSSCMWDCVKGSCGIVSEAREGLGHSRVLFRLCEIYTRMLVQAQSRTLKLSDTLIASNQVTCKDPERPGC